MKNIIGLEFKGNRNYLHGSDIYNSIDKIAKERFDGWVSSITFRSIAKNQLELVWEKPLDKNNVCVTGKITDKVLVKHDFWLVDTNSSIQNRYEFNEKLITDSSLVNLEKREVQLSYHTQYTPVEEIIALTKQLNYTITPVVLGKWLFSQLDITERLNNNGNFKILMRSLLAGKFSINEIYISDKLVGTIRFVVGEA